MKGSYKSGHKKNRRAKHYWITMKILTATAALVIAAIPAYADTRDLLFDCMKPTFKKNLEQVRERSKEILSGSLLPEDAIQGKWALSCLKITENIEYTYDIADGKIKPKSADQIAKEAEALAEQKRLEEEEELAKQEKAAEAIRLEKELDCSIDLLEQKILELKGELGIIKDARALETESLIAKSCGRVYKNDPSAALLNSVCAEHFRYHGVPDTSFPLSFEVSELSRLTGELLNLQIKRIQHRRPESRGRSDHSKNLDACADLTEEN